MNRGYSTSYQKACNKIKFFISGRTKELGKSHRIVAEELGIPQATYYYRLEHICDMNLKDVLELLSHLDITEEDLKYVLGDICTR